MTRDQLINGYETYICNIYKTLSLDPIILINHPQEQQKTIVYDRKRIQDWLRDHDNKCPITRVTLVGPLQEMRSLQMECLMFCLDAAQHLDKLNEDDELMKDDILNFLNQMREKHPALIKQAQDNLTRLANDDRVDLSLETISDLLSFGIKGNLKKQRAHLEPQQREELARRLQQVETKVRIEKDRELEQELARRQQHHQALMQQQLSRAQQEHQATLQQALERQKAELNARAQQHHEERSPERKVSAEPMEVESHGPMQEFRYSKQLFDLKNTTYLEPRGFVPYFKNKSNEYTQMLEFIIMQQRSNEAIEYYFRF